MSEGLFNDFCQRVTELESDFNSKIGRQRRWATSDMNMDTEAGRKIAHQLDKLDQIFAKKVNDHANRFRDLYFRLLSEYGPPEESLTSDEGDEQHGEESPPQSE